MRSRTRLLNGLAAFGALAFSSTAAAQTCIGLPRTSMAPVNVSANIGFPDEASVLGARLGFGGQNGFGGVSVGFTDYDNVSNSSFTIGGDLGYSVPVNSRRTTTLCPIVSLSYRNGPNEDPVENTGLGLLAGAALGGEVDVSDNFALVPHASVGVLYLRAKSSNGDESVTASETGGQVGAGISFQFNRIFSITPSVAFPVGFDGDTDPIFSIGMSLGFRRR